MIDFYNAFISYRHAKLDMSIASHIQRKLEHFHVPHKLKKKLKHQKINRIFRDKDELPITSDLTETITDALAKSEYLIVICSTNTKDSMWVKREIQTFLQTHTKDKILTVLCNGEPQDVIPEELLTGEKIITDANGFQHTIKVPVEPLSCDYRLSRSRADNEELPRLASALLGCSYDELQRRNRQYRIRRVAAIVAAAFLAMAGFMTYSLIMSKKINDNYIESLRNKSQYLSTTSEQLLDADLRTDAVHIALEALPKDNKDKMPVTASAIRALTDATAAYQSNAGNNIAPTWNYRTDHAIKMIKVSPSEKYVAALDVAGDIYCWDTLSHDLVFRKNGDYHPLDMLFMEDDFILIIYSQHMEAYNIQTGTDVWEYKLDPDKYAEFFKDEVIYQAGSVYLDIGDGCVARLSSRDGSEKEIYKLKESSFLDSVECLTVSSDGKRIAYADSDFVFGEDYKIHIYDTETKADYSNFPDTFYIESLNLIENGYLCAITDSDLSDGSMQIADDVTAVRSGSKEIFCYDDKMNELWHDKLIYTDEDIVTGVLYIPSREAVVFYTGNVATIYDINTGEALIHYQTGSTLIAVNDFNQNGLPEFICRHGEYAFAVSNTSNSLQSFDSICNNAHYGVIGDFIYAAAYGSTDLIAYNRFLQDDEWNSINSGSIIGSSYFVSYVKDDYLIVCSSINDATGIRICIIDQNEADIVFTTDIEITNGYITDNFSIESVGDSIYGCFADSIYEIDTENFTVEKLDVVVETPEYISNGKIYSCKLSYSDEQIDVIVSDLDRTNEQDFTIEVDEYKSSVFSHVQYIESINTLFIPYQHHMYAINLATEEIEEIELPDEWEIVYTYRFYVTTFDDDSKILLSDGSNVIVTDTSYKKLYSFRCNCTTRCFAFYKDKVLYIVDDDYLLRYEANTGTLIGKHETSINGLGVNRAYFDDKNHYLYIQIDDQISLFDTNEWVELACVKNAYSYHPETDRFFVYSYVLSDECTPGWIKHYSLEDLRAKAKLYLGEHELDEVTKNKYGIT